MGVLDEIVATKRAELALLHQPETRDTLRRAALAAPAPRDFAGALRPADARLAVIGEIKRRSPSKGELAPGLDPAATARAFESGGAAALSVLTDTPYFGGSIDDLRGARAAVHLPVLRKDFTIDDTQVYESRALGADAILLIVAALPDGTVLRDLHALAVDVGLAVLVEVHDELELERALAAGAGVIGVNARDLATFGEDLAVSERLAAQIPADAIAVAESAIRSPDDAARMAEAGFDAVLVGEALVRAADPAALLSAMTAATVRRRA